MQSIKKRFICAVLGAILPFLEPLINFGQSPPETQPQSSLPPILQLTSQNPREATNGSINGSLLVRELQRQAIGIAAREGFGLRTRDMALDETFSQSNPTLLIGTQFQRAYGTDTIIALPTGTPDLLAFPDLDLKKYTDNAPDKLLLSRHTVLWADPWLDYARIVTENESYSHHDFLDALKKANILGALVPRPVGWSTASTLPDVAEKELLDMNPIAQFVAVRLLHDEARKTGESPQMLDALARGYANLAFLTRPNFNGAYKTYMARSLLYAERFISRSKSGVRALYARAYARGMAGFAQLALDDIAAARKKQPNGKGKFPEPEWVPIMEAWCHYNLVDMQAAAKKPGQYQSLAEMLTLAIALDGYSPAKIIEVAKDCLQKQSDNIWAMQSLYEIGGLGMPGTMPDAILLGLPTFLQTHAKLLALPDALDKLRAKLGTDASPQYADVAAFAKALAETSQADEGEPSLSALSALIRDEEFTAAYMHADHLKDQIGVGSGPTGEFAKESEPAWRDHRLGGYMQALAMDEGADHAAYRAVLEKVQPVDAGSWLMDIVIPSFDYEQYFVNWNKWLIAEGHADLLPLDFLRVSISEPRLYINEFMDALRKESPDAALSAWAWLMNTPDSKRLENQTETEKTITDIQQHFAGRPLVIQEAALWASDIHDRKTALSLLNNLQAADPSWATTSVIIHEYNLADKMDDAIAAVQASSKIPSVGLEEASISGGLAQMLMRRHRYADALPFARQAADSYSSWGLKDLAACEQVLGHPDIAETTLAACSERYPGQVWSWYTFAKILQRPDLPKAKSALDQYLSAHPDDYEAHYTMALFDGDVSQAFKIVKDHRAAMASALGLIEYAAIAAEAGDNAEAEAALKKELAYNSNLIQQTTAVGMIAILHGGDVQTSLLPLELRSGPPLTRDDGYENWLGRFLAATGHTPEAIHYLTRALIQYDTTTRSNPLATVALKKLGQDSAALVAAEQNRKVDLTPLIGTWHAQDPTDQADWTFSSDYTVLSSNGLHGLWWENQDRIYINWTPTKWAVFSSKIGIDSIHGDCPAGTGKLTLTKK